MVSAGSRGEGVAGGVEEESASASSLDPLYSNEIALKTEDTDAENVQYLMEEDLTKDPENLVQQTYFDDIFEKEGAPETVEEGEDASGFVEQESDEEVATVEGPTAAQVL